MRPQKNVDDSGDEEPEIEEEGIDSRAETGSRPSRPRKLSKKQAENEEETVIKLAEQKMKAMKKEIKRLKLKSADKAVRRQPEVSEPEYESEEETLSHEQQRGVLSSSIRCLHAEPDAVSEGDRTPLRAIRSTTNSMALSNSSRLPEDSPAMTDTESDSATLAKALKKHPHSSSRSVPATSEPISKRTKKNLPPLREGSHQDVKNPKASDYEEHVTKIILRAASEYEALISTQDAFPDTSKRVKWARQVWKTSCEKDSETFECTTAINQIIRARGSRICGSVVTLIRPLVQLTFGFQRGADAKTKAANLQLAAHLRKKALFHYKNNETQSGFMQAKYIRDALQTVWFGKKNAVGVIFCKLFEPIPLETLAFILTVTDFCLSEWSTGSHEIATFREKEYESHHIQFRKDVREWEDLNAKAVEGIRKRLFARLLQDSGAVKEVSPGPTLDNVDRDRIRAELEGRTGETDSEAENET